jgi:hypothetical protein
MDININFDQDATNRYRDYHAEKDPDHVVENLIANDNFDNNTSYGKTNEIFELMNNEEFSPGASILNINSNGSHSLLVNWKIHQTKSKHSYFSLQINQDVTSKVVKIVSEEKSNNIIMELFKPDVLLPLKTNKEIEELLLSKKAEGDVHSDTASGTIAIPAGWCNTVSASIDSKDLALKLIKETARWVRCQPELADNDWIKNMFNFSQLLFMMSNMDTSIDTIGIKIIDIASEKKPYGLTAIKEIVTDFEKNSKPDNVETRLPTCTECHAHTHLTANCPNLAAKEGPKEVDDDDSIETVAGIFERPIPKRKKTEKEDPPDSEEDEPEPENNKKEQEDPIDSDEDEGSTDSISLNEANFSSTRDKYKETAAKDSASSDPTTNMAYVIAKIMKSEKNVLSKTSTLGIESLESITTDFKGNGGVKMNNPVLKILMETSDKEDIPKFFNSELRRALRDDDDPIGRIDKKTANLIMKGHLVGDDTIRDPKEMEGISIFTIVPPGETASSKSATGQNIFMPSTAEQFLEMLRSFKILLRFLGGKKSAIAIQSNKLHANFKKVKINLKEFFVTNGENGGKYLCLIIHNLTFNMLCDIINKIVPSTDHLEMNSLIMQLQIGMAIPIPMSKSPVFPSGDKKRIDDRKRKQDRVYDNHPPASPRSVGEYVFEEGKDYGKFFSGRAIAKHQPACPKVKGKNICIGYLVNGKCNNANCKNFHGSTKSATDYISKWISGNSLPLKIRE